MSNDPDVSTSEETEVNESGKCFVIAPIGSDGSDTRKRTENLYRHTIQPVVADFNLEAEIAHKISEPGDIPKQVVRLLFDAELVIADLTDHNANVMYELAIRHAAGGPVVKIAKEGHTPPFDIWSQRTKFYRAGFGGAEEFKEKLRGAIGDALDPDHSPDNPIQRARRDFTFDKVMEGKIEELASEGKAELSEVLQQLLGRIDNLESRVSASSKGRWPATSASPFSAATPKEGSLLQIPSPLASERTEELVGRLQREPEILDASYHEDPDGDAWLRIRHSISTTETGVKAMVSVHSRQVEEDETEK